MTIELTLNHGFAQFDKKHQRSSKILLSVFQIRPNNSIIETKKLRDIETGEAFSGNGPEKGAEATLRSGSKTYEAGKVTK